ncbi:MAG: response regulator transcription factor [bacterium]|nr:response regulator transcription factor [bacterium]
MTDVLRGIDDESGGSALRILYIEDNPTAREYVKRGLEPRGIEVEICADGAEGLERALSERFEMILLDLGLPSMDGLEVLSKLREAGGETPILVLSARSHTIDRIEGLNLGADDYLAKPYALEELVARIRAIRRRIETEDRSPELVVADLKLDIERRAVFRDGQLIGLTPKEFALLEQLMRNEGRALSRSMITEHVWGPAFEVSSHVISVHINHLRGKVDEGFGRRLIHTVSGMGYILEDRGQE